MLSCPRCKSSLESRRHAAGMHFLCPSCKGHASNFAILRQQLDPAFLQGLWLGIRDAPASARHRRLPCPSCAQPMHPASVGHPDTPIQLDACRNCQMLWLDDGELEQLPARPAPQLLADPAPGTGIEPSESLAPSLLRGEAFRTGSLTIQGAAPPPDSFRDLILTLLGIPVPEDAPEKTIRPLATWFLAGTSATLTLTALLLGVLPHLIASAGFLPEDPFRLAGLTLLLSFFIHGNLLHLFFNLAFLALAGHTVEQLLGRARFFSLVLSGSLTSLAFHSALHPAPNIPLVGASGGIAALLIFYAVALPKVRLVFCLRIGFWPIWIRPSAATAAAIWFTIQLLGLLFFQQNSGTSYAAHLGGAIAGLTLASFWKLLAHSPHHRPRLPAKVSGTAKRSS
jgi:membrane associated rhomboid family serine protease/Zn-finger nucleic acid-binding protein